MDDADITVACVLWMGDFRGRRYSPEWVRRLRNMVARNLSRPHRFVCLSNVDVEGIETVPLVSDLPGWFAKLELFRPGNGLRGRVLYLDLDTLVTGDLGEIADYPSRFAMMPPSFELVEGGQPAGGPGIVDRYQSSVMVWDAVEGCDVWESVPSDVQTRYRGDQDFLGDALPGAAKLPAEWFIKLRHCPEGAPEGVKVVLSMPDKNDVAAEKHAWVNRIWR